jgi:hypothetical protein
VRSGIGAQAPEGVDAMRRKNMGSSVDDFLKEEGIFEEAQAQAVKELVAWQLAQAFPTEGRVNAALRVLAGPIQKHGTPKAPPRRRV